MATPQETLQEMIASMRTPTTPAPAGAARSAVSMNGNTSIRQPGMTAGRSSVSTANPAGRLAAGNRLLDNPVQASRTGTEANLNPQVGESLRRSLIEQQRLSGPTFGSMGAFERRDRRDARTANQASVNSGLAALQGMREGSLTERGQNLASTTTLEDRQMQETGAFDRSLLALDNTMLEGQFGLTDRAAQVAGADPFAGITLDLMTQIAEAEGTTNADRIGLINVGRGQGPMGTPGNPWTMTVDGTGTSFEGPGSETGALLARVLQAGGPGTSEGRLLLTEAGMSMGEDGRMRTLEAADAAAAGATESQNALKRAIDFNAEQEAFMKEQLEKRRRNNPPTPFQPHNRQNLSAPFGDMMSITPGGVR
jgi:hypothetical protein